MKHFRSKKGMTLIETIIALAVLGIVSVPLMAVFTNAAVIVKKTDDRLEINAVTRIIKENVIRSVKYGGLGNAIYSYEYGKKIDLKTGLDEDGISRNTINLQVKNSEEEVNTKYKFDAERTMEFNSIANPGNTGSHLNDTCEYLITLKTENGDMVQKLRILINRID